MKKEFNYLSSIDFIEKNLPTLLNNPSSYLAWCLLIKTDRECFTLRSLGQELRLEDKQLAIFLDTLDDNEDFSPFFNLESTLEDIKNDFDDTNNYTWYGVIVNYPMLEIWSDWGNEIFLYKGMVK